MKRIFVVEDDKSICRIIQLQLQHANFKVLMSYTGNDAIVTFNQYEGKIDLVLLDVMLPGCDGFSVLSAIRQINKQVPVIFLTARDDKKDVIRGLNNGANDYIKKPFDFDELIARINANLRNNMTPQKLHQEKMGYKDLIINTTTFEVFRENQKIHLSRTEYDLLYYLLINHHLVQTRGQIIDHVWGYDYDGSENVVDVYIKYLRDKIDKPFEQKYIHTIRGRGYVLQ
ncbi:MAG: response regulator transcription factor [Eubacteriaceae bacterium]|nr:response regulator transcription factor [Eubacteriaceae bacterium]MDD4507697.1 response regulator transcription factor [Eubacteriaceae bacterium]